jgi:hypothetical protein
MVDSQVVFILFVGGLWVKFLVGFVGGLWVVPLVVLWGELCIYLGLGMCTYKWIC